MKGYMQILRKEHAHELVAHRMRGFASVEHLNVDPEALEWNESDEKSFLLGIRNCKDELIASQRMEILYNEEELKCKIDYDDLPVNYPVGLLGKAITEQDYRGCGLNSYMGYMAYQYFYAKGLSHVVCTVMPSSPLLKLIIKLGYELIDNPKGWKRFGYQTEGNTLVCILDLQKNYTRVLKTLRELIPEGEIKALQTL